MEEGAGVVDEREGPDDPTALLRDGHVAAVERLVPDYVSRIDWPLVRLQEERNSGR